MFYGRFRIRVFSDTLRAFAAGRLVGANETVPPPKPPSLADLPELDLFFREIFVAPDAFVCMNPLDQVGRDYWSDLEAAYEKGNFHKAREMAVSFADWLDATYQKAERLQFDDESFSVVLDGELYSRLRPEGYVLLKLLAVHKERGRFVSAEEIIAAFNDLGTNSSTVFACVGGFPPGSAGLKRLSRAVEYLPPPLRKLIQSQRGSGRRLCLEPA